MDIDNHSKTSEERNYFRKGAPNHAALWNRRGSWNSADLEEYDDEDEYGSNEYYDEGEDGRSSRSSNSNSAEPSSPRSGQDSQVHEPGSPKSNWNSHSEEEIDGEALKWPDWVCN